MRAVMLVVLSMALWPIAAQAQGDLVIEPGQHDFGQVAPGTSADGLLEVWNDGLESLTLGAIGVGGDSDPFDLDEDGCISGLVLDPGWGCDLGVSFVAPAARGNYQAVVSVAAVESGEVATALLAGSSFVAGHLVAESAWVDFGVVSSVMTSPSQRGEVRNSGDAAITLGSPSVRMLGRARNHYDLTASVCGVLSPGQMCEVGVAFSPSTWPTMIGGQPVFDPGGVFDVRLEFLLESGTVALAVPLRAVVPSGPPLPRARPRKPLIEYGAVEQHLAYLADSLPALLRGGPRRALRLPSFKAPTAGHLSLHVRGVGHRRHLRLAKSTIELTAGESGRLRFSLTRKARILLRRPTKMIVRGSVAFTARATSETFRQALELTIRRPARLRKAR